MSSLQTRIRLDNEDVDVVDVVVTYEGGFYSPGRREGPPDSWEPSYGEDPEITSVRALVSGEELLPKLSEELIEALIKKVWEHKNALDRDIPDDYDDVPDDVVYNYDPY